MYKNTEFLLPKGEWVYYNMPNNRGQSKQTVRDWLFRRQDMRKINAVDENLAAIRLPNPVIIDDFVVTEFYTSMNSIQKYGEDY